MHFRSSMLGAYAAFFLLGSTIAVTAQQALSAEPPPGQLNAGQSVLVDDGTCGKGKIKRVTGGDNLGGGKSPRKRECVADRRLKTAPR